MAKRKAGKKKNMPKLISRNEFMFVVVSTYLIGVCVYKYIDLLNKKNIELKVVAFSVIIYTSN